MTGPSGYCHPGELHHRIYEEMRADSDVEDRVRIWRQRDRVAGIAICTRYSTAFDLFVAPDLRGSAQERIWIEAATQRTATLLMREGAEVPYVLTDVDADDTIRRQVLDSLGFEHFRTWDHHAVRRLDHVEPIDAPRGFRVRHARPADAEGLAQARQSAFGTLWRPNEYRRAVMARPGYRPQDELVAVAPSGRLAAFAVVRLDGRNGVGQLEPVGTHAEFRARGLGRAVLSNALSYMRSQGMSQASVHYDATNNPAARLYAAAGFQVAGSTVGYRRATGPT